MSNEIKKFFEAFEQGDVKQLKEIINSNDVWRNPSTEFNNNLRRREYAVYYKDRLDHLKEFPFNEGLCEGEKERNVVFLKNEILKEIPGLYSKETLEELYHKKQKDRKEYDARSKIPSRLEAAMAEKPVTPRPELR